mgnify:CR=1 FL=1
MTAFVLGTKYWVGKMVAMKIFPCSLPPAVLLSSMSPQKMRGRTQSLEGSQHQDRGHSRPLANGQLVCTSDSSLASPPFLSPWGVIFSLRVVFLGTLRRGRGIVGIGMCISFSPGSYTCSAEANPGVCQGGCSPQGSFVPERPSIFQRCASSGDLDAVFYPFRIHLLAPRCLISWSYVSSVAASTSPDPMMYANHTRYDPGGFSPVRLVGTQSRVSPVCSPLVPSITAFHWGCVSFTSTSMPLL